MSKMLKGSAVAYALMAVVVFGHAHTTQKKFETLGEDLVARVVASMVCSVFWPLYVSSKAWKHFLTQKE